MNKIKILGFEIRNSNENELIKKIEKQISEKNKYVLHHINPHIILSAIKNNKLKKALNSFSDLYLDGIGLFIASKILYGKFGFKQRMTGTDFYSSLLRSANKNKRSIFFFGGSVESSERITKIVNSTYPNVSVKGAISRNDYNTKEFYNFNEADILFVGLGSPLQEIWAAENFKKIDATVTICVGSGIDYLSGIYKRAPITMRKWGLEWFWRLLYDPKRLWRRYLIGNFIFIHKILMQKVSKNYENF